MYVDIAGSGDPLYLAELCKWRSYGHSRSNGAGFFANRHFIYKLSVIKQKTGQKTGKNPPKRMIFSGPPTSWLSLDRFWPGQNLSKLNQLVGGAEKIIFIGEFLPVFCPVFCFFTDNLYMEWRFCKKKSVQLTFSSHRSVIYKVPPRIGGHHFLLCQQTNTKDIAGQSIGCCHE